MRTEEEVLEDLRDAKDRKDQAYWTFTRTAKGSPPPAHHYEEITRLKKELREIHQANRTREKGK